jgi:hypothetical protein
MLGPLNRQIGRERSAIKQISHIWTWAVRTSALVRLSTQSSQAVNCTI